MDKEAALQQIRTGKARTNNGRVLRTINLLRTKYIGLRDIKYALPDMTESELQDSVNYLDEAAYIELRHVETRAPISTGLADHDYRDIEAKLTAKGIQLLADCIKDPLIEV